MRDIKIKINGKKRRLKYDAAAFHRVSEKMSVEQIKKTIGQDLSVKALSLILWAGLIHEDPVLNLNEVEKIVKESNPRILKALRKAIKKATCSYAQTLDQSIKEVTEITNKYNKLGKRLAALEKKRK